MHPDLPRPARPCGSVADIELFHRDRCRFSSRCCRMVMAARMGVARWGQQRSLVRIFQHLRTAAPRSPGSRAVAMLRLTAFWLADSACP